MKIRLMMLFAVALHIMTVTVVFAQQPSIIVLSTQNSVTVKIVDPTAYQSKAKLSFAIGHWPDGKLLTKGAILPEQINNDSLGYPTFEIRGLKPRLWSPQDPQLYSIAVTNANGQIIGKTRFGFRTFEVKNRKFYLNGRVIFLRGLPINPPGRDLPKETGEDIKFIRSYLQLVKNAGVNMVRTETSGIAIPETKGWLDVCDEIGLLVDQGNYGGAPANGGKTTIPPIEPAKQFYRKMVITLANHPSIVIYFLTNEMNQEKYRDFLNAMREEVRLIDPTRPVIGNAGYGKGESGEIFDYHKYRGWYYNNYSDWYAEFKDWNDLADAASKPFTVSECVGAYTADSGHFQTLSKQMAPMFRWVGATDDPKAAALAYQAEAVKEITEIARRRRTTETGVTGVMPFTYFFGWASARKFDDMTIKPAFKALKVAFQPVLISPECWKKNIYAGEKLQIHLCVINDDDNGRNLTASQALVDIIKSDGSLVSSGKISFPTVPYYSNSWKDIAIPTPVTLPRGDYTVKCRLIENKKEISRNSFIITVAPKEWVKTSAEVAVFDPAGNTTLALKKLGAKVTKIISLSEFPQNGVLVIGEDAFKSGSPTKTAVDDFLARGGRILCLSQSPDNWKSDWLPANYNLPESAPFSYVQPIGGNTMLYKDLRMRDFRYWNELGRSEKGTPDVCPVLTPLRPSAPLDLKSARIWAATDHLLSGAVVVELFQGKGRIILSQFRCVDRVDNDPIAAKLLSNLVSYAASAEHPGLLDLSKPIKWDLEAVRTGAFQSTIQGFYGHSKTYSYRGSAKGMLGADHSVDGFTLVGSYKFTFNGFISPVPALYGEGWGFIYGALTKPAEKFKLKVQNPSTLPGEMKLRLDGQEINNSVQVAPGAEYMLEWPVNRQPGPIEIELRGTRSLVIKESAFE